MDVPTSQPDTTCDCSDYVAKNAHLLSNEEKSKWKIKPGDYFTIYFKNSKDLPEDFKKDLKGFY